MRVRYRLPETLRDYGRNRLAQLGQEELFRRRHCDYFRAVGRDAWGEWFGPQQVQCASRMLDEQVNLQAAFEYGQADWKAVDGGLELAFVVALNWSAAGSFAEGRLILERALAADPLPSRARAAVSAVAA